MNNRQKPTETPSLVVDDSGEVIEATPANRFRASVLSGDEVLTIKPLRWLVPGWLPSDSIAAIYSEPGVGKSTYALTLALELASGGKWCGHKLEPVTVLYVAAERATLTRDRLEAWTTYTGQQIPRNFHALNDAPQLGDYAHTGEITQLIKELGAGVVIIDTYARTALGVDENSSRDTGRTMEALSEYVKATGGGSVVVVHHSGKDSARGLRGSTAFLGAVDLTVRLSTEDKERGIVRASVEKSNAAKEPLPEHYRFHSVQLDPLGGDLFREAAVLLPEKFETVRTGLDSDLLKLITENPGQQQRDLVELSGRSKGPVQKALIRLEMRRLIEKRREGRAVFYYPSPNPGEAF